jgi:tol-pal system protein YbgF
MQLPHLIMTLRLISRAALLLALAAALPARAGLFNDDEARARVDQLRRELTARIEKNEAAQHGQIDLANQMEELRQEVARLRGENEVLTHEVEQLQKRQQDLYVDLDNRLRKLEGGSRPDVHTDSSPGGMTGTTSPAEPPASVAKGSAEAERRDYEGALKLFKAGKYKEASSAFDAFIKNYGSSGFQANAHYWLGNSLYQQRDYRRAKDVFLKVPVSWPDDPKAADALLGVANCQIDSGDAKGSRATLENLVAKYPSSTAAQIAKQRLGKKKG